MRQLVPDIDVIDNPPCNVQKLKADLLAQKQLIPNWLDEIDTRYESSLTETTRYYNNLNQLANRNQDQNIVTMTRHLDKLITEIQALKQSEQYPTINLARVLDGKNHLLACVTSNSLTTQQKTNAIEEYTSLVHEYYVQGAPSSTLHSLGVLMIALGAAIAALGPICLALVAVEGVIAAASIGFFVAGRQTGISKAMYELGKNAVSHPEAGAANAPPVEQRPAEATTADDTIPTLLPGP